MSKQKEIVVLLHGILRSKTDMLPLTRFLRKNGYDCINILYPSRKKPLEDLAEYVHQKIINAPEYTPEKTLNFVTHSMGGLIARYYIEKYTPAALGRVVMLSPPNTGSEFADILSAHKLLAKPYRFFFGPAGAQLKTDYAHIDTPPISYPLGVIAGTKSINPLALWALPREIVGPHDGIVPVARTKIEGMNDHISLPTNHTIMMFSPKVMQQTLHFLKYETFDK